MVAHDHDWRLQAVDWLDKPLGFITGWESLKLVARARRGGTWQLVAGERTEGVELLQPGTRLKIRRAYPARRATYAEAMADIGTYAGAGVESEPYSDVAAGWVTSIREDVKSAGRSITISGITDIALLADRIILPTPQNAFNAQDASSHWDETGPAKYVIHRLITRNAGFGAHRGRQSLDSRVGVRVVDSPTKPIAPPEPPDPPVDPPPLVDKTFTTATNENSWRTYALVQTGQIGTGQPFWDANTPNLYYGRYDGANGLQSSAVAFGGLSRLGLDGIDADEVTGGSISFYSAHTYNTSAVLLVHPIDYPPMKWPYTVPAYNTTNNMRLIVPKGGWVTVDLPLQWAKWLTDGGAVRGFYLTAEGLTQDGYGYVSAGSLSVTIRYREA